MRIIDRVVSSIQTVTADIVLSANDQDASQWLPGVPILSDKTPMLGGLSGILAGLLHGRAGRDVLVVAWDMPFVHPDLLARMVAVGREKSATAVVPESDSPYGIEPFCGWYSASAREPLEEFLASGGGTARSFVERLPDVRRLSLGEARQFGAPAVLFLSVNTAADLARARAIADAAE